MFLKIHPSEITKLFLKSVFQSFTLWYVFFELRNTFQNVLTHFINSISFYRIENILYNLKYINKSIMSRYKVFLLLK